MTDRHASWIDRYVAAWESNAPTAIAGLFTEGARYYTAPYREPWVGREAIVAGWVAIDDRPGTWTFESEVEAVVDATAYVRGRTVYTHPPTAYSNLWRITLAPDGRCSEFVEWWMDESESA